MLYNISAEKVSDVAAIAEKLKRLSPLALAYVDGAVNMALTLSGDDDAPASA